MSSRAYGCSKSVIFGCAAAGVLGLSSMSRANVIYDLETSLENGANAGTLDTFQAGQYSFGYYSTALTPSSFSLFSAFQDDPAVFYITGQSDPNINFNDTSGYVYGNGFTLAPDEIAVGPYKGPTVIRFTAPTTGTYQITSKFTDIQEQNSVPTAEVFDDNTELASGTAALSSGYTYTNSGLQLTAGDTIDFVTDADNNTNNATTSLTATLTLVTPEPATSSVLGVATTALLLRRRRSRQERGNKTVSR
jgi:hypothetical protein